MGARPGLCAAPPRARPRHRGGGAREYGAAPPRAAGRGLEPERAAYGDGRVHGGGLARPLRRPPRDSRPPDRGESGRVATAAGRAEGEGEKATVTQAASTDRRRTKTVHPRGPTEHRQGESAVHRLS